MLAWCRRILVGSALLFLVAGCASVGLERPRGVLRLGMEDAPEGRRVFFPPPPEVPRYSYAGQLIGERNFVPDAAARVSAWARFWRALVGQAGTENLIELARPQGVVTDTRKRILVTDVGVPSIRVFDPQAGRLAVWEYAAPGQQFVSPVSIVSTRDGGFLVSDSSLGLIAHLGPDGQPLHPFGEGIVARPTGLAHDGERLFVADAQTHQVHVFDLASGAKVASWGARGHGPGEFSGPTFLLLHGNELFVSDTLNARVQVLDKRDGSYLRSIGSRGTRLGQFMLPKGLASDSDGNLYVIDSYFDSMLVFAPRGELLLHIGGTGYASGNFFSPSAVWVDSSNMVYLTDTFNGRVVLFQFLGGD